MHAAFDDTLEIAYHLIKAGADPNIRDDNGKTALFYSYGFHRGSIEMVRLLLRSGADVHRVDK